MALFVGFYWTLPVNRRAFTRLPLQEGIEAAARKSRTIRYQMELVRRYVASVGDSELLKEFAAIEMTPDRGTLAIVDDLKAPIALCRTHKATLLYVKFWKSFYWRHHPFIESTLKEASIFYYGLSPDPIQFDDGEEEFDPTKHFREWNERHAEDRRALSVRAEQELALLMPKLVRNPRRNQIAADNLNGRGILSKTGQEWSADMVRKVWGGIKPASTLTETRS